MSPTPRIFSADRIIDGNPGLFGEASPWNINIEDQDVARAGEKQVEAGADLIKVYGWILKEVMMSVVQETKKYDREVSCDLIHAVKVNAVDAVKSGVKWNKACIWIHSSHVSSMEYEFRFRRYSSSWYRYPCWSMEYSLDGSSQGIRVVVEAGFSEMDALLRSATCVAAKALYKNNLGSIKEGALADIVILNSNPIEDMRNTKAIDSVIKGGRVYSQADILESVPTEDYSKRILEEFLNEFEKQ
jgi:hypothetical protein